MSKQISLQHLSVCRHPGVKELAEGDPHATRTQRGTGEVTDGYSACQAPPALSPISKDSGVSCLLGTTRSSARSLKLHRAADMDSEKQPRPRAPTGSREAAQQMPRHNGDLEGHNLPLSSPFIPTPVIRLIWAKHKPQCFQPPPATRRHALETARGSAPLTSARKAPTAKEPPRSDQSCCYFAVSPISQKLQ